VAQITFGTERREEEKEGGTGLSRSQSRQPFWRDSVTPSALVRLKATRRTVNEPSVAPQQSAQLSHTNGLDVTQADVAPHRYQATRLPPVSRKCIWRDSFMSRVNRTDVTQISRFWK
jgi:hypothetical protein